MSSVHIHKARKPRLPVRLFNIMKNGSRISFDFDKLIHSARKKTGMYDLGADFWDEPLRLLLKCADEEAQLHPFGRFMFRTKMTDQLEARLRAVDWFKKKPEILEQELLPILLISGLQRTGTTKLQRILSSNEDGRELRSWEALQPAPIGDWEEYSKRLAKTKMNEKAVKYLSPELFSIHPIHPNGPEGDVLLLDLHFMSTAPEAILNVPSFSAWLEKQDHEQAYAFEKKLLLLLQFQRKAKFWVLKSPHHLEHFDVINKIYEDVNFIWMHRRVEQCIPSFLSMIFYSRKLFSNQVNPEIVGRQWFNKNKLMLAAAMEHRRQLGNDQIIDILYSDLMENTLGCVETIYETFNINWNEPHRKAYQSKIEELQANHRFRHKYKLEDFGLTQQQVVDELKQYNNYFETLNNKTHG